ncbi:MAG: preprotein translocase subunit SecE [Gammaproteobacteria bacterium]|nr:MAG: preprotein translocase subunit SecE [Gammaproteobacteria bacterium]
MASKPEQTGSTLDTVKLAVSALLLVAGVIGFYYYEEQATLYRVLGLLAVTGVAVAIAMTTAIGRALWAFMGEARAEVRKMVWPSRAETVQTTLAVFIMVVLMGIFLWLLDMLLGWAVRHVVA